MDQTYMKKENVLKLLITMALPMVISMLVNSLYNIVDSFFVAQISEDAMTAISLVFPMQNFINSVMIGFGIGINSVISFYMGAQDKVQADKAASQGILLATIHGIVMTAGCIMLIKPFLCMFTNDSSIVELGLQYSYIAFAFSTILAWQLVFEKTFQAVGRMTTTMICMMVGFVVNIVLDPVMILMLGWGVTGAALATIIGNIAACLFYLQYFLRKKSTLSISWKYFKVGEGIAKSVVAIGIPASLNNILMSFANIILNQALVGYGDTPVAAMGVALKSNMLVVLLQIGLCVGIQPLIGYNYGAGNKKRLMQVFKFTGIVSVIMGTILTLFMMVARKSLVQVFINDAQVITYGIQMVIALQLSAPFLGILFLCINTIQGMGKAIPSLLLTVCRQGLIFIPLIFILNHMFGLEGVIYAQPAADYLSIVVAILICTHLFRTMEHRNESVEA